MNRFVQAFIISLSVVPAVAPAGVAGTLPLAEGDVPTLKQIMADPSWIARSPESAAWLADGSGVVFEQRRPGVLGRDTKDRLVLMLDGVTAAGWPRMLEDAELAGALAADGDWSADRSLLVVERGGDVFLWDRADGWTQLTRTTDREVSPRLMADRSVAFRRGGSWFVRETGGLEREAADIRFEEDPAAKEAPELDDLAQSQRDLFAVFQEKAKRDELNETTERSRRDADPTRTPGPFYLDPKRREGGTWLSPSGRAMLVATGPERPASERTDQMPSYVTESGFVETQRLRAKVADGRRDPVGFVLLDLEDEKAHELKLDELPMIRDDPLAEIKAATEARAKKDHAKDAEDEEPEADAEAKDEASTGGKPGKIRPISSLGVQWSDSGRFGAAMLRSNDNKDRWLVAVDTDAAEPAWRVVHHTRDPAWIAWEFNGFGFVPGTESLWFQSEHAGWGHLYLAELENSDAAVRALTSGPWEVREVTPAHDGSGFWVRTNRTDHGVYEIEQVAMDGTLTPITALGGAVESFELSPDESRILFTWSDTMDPPELYAVAADGSARPARLTKTDTALYRSFDFVEPEFVRVPSSHAEGDIHMRVYRPDPDRFPGPRPMVVFAHGAGYLQFAYRGWSNYFREHLFHTLLTERGIMVLGPDYRHSEGYGRDWRTAVYRDMGEPELQDFDDCLVFAARQLDGDMERVGIYGGSYGGFLTLMGLFLRPDVYDAGAALRSVADWRQYSYGWTGNILDTPQVDPEPFDRSSPITHAAGLKGALLMCHGLVDDNVVAQDVIRLSQRLIELEKTDWELALYPVEPHGFVEPSSWFDEYRRILELFEEHLLEK